MNFRKSGFQWIFIFIVSFVSLMGKAEETYYKSELSGGVDSTAGYVRINMITQNYIQYSFTGSFSYSLDRTFQLGLQTGIADSGAPLDSFRFSFYIPFTLNWGGSDLRDDYFVRLSPGISYYNALNTALLVQFGKRFKLLDNFSWRPTVGLASQFGNGAARIAIDIVPLAFSVIF